MFVCPKDTLLVNPNLANTKWRKKTLQNGWKSDIWVLILEYSEKATV